MKLSYSNNELLNTSRSFQNENTSLPAVRQRPRKQEQLSKLAAMHSLNALLLTKPDGSIIYANKAAMRLFGYSAKEFQYLNRQTIIDHLDHRANILLNERQLSGICSGELTGIHKNGKRFPVEFYSSTFKDDAGNTLNSNTVINITDKKDTIEGLSKQLKDCRHLLNTNSLLLNSTEESYIMISKELKIMDFNAAADHMVDCFYGFHLSRGMALKLLADIEKEGLWMSIFESIVHAGSSKKETRYNLPDGTFKVYMHNFNKVHSDQDEMIMIVTSTDITEMKIAQQTLLEQRLNRQKQVTEATIQAQEKERTHLGKELHDNINQILTTTRLYIDMAKAEDDIRELLLNRSLENISKAIEEIRKLSKSLVPPSLGDIGLKEAIAEMISGLTVTKTLQITLKTTDFKESLLNDEMKLMIFRMVQEQLNNIIKHAKAACAEVNLSIAGNKLELIVTDDGVGFDSKKKTKGIGLSNIASRAEMYHGSMKILSAPGKGCSLCVRIPL